jgi:hypothetical protein
VSQDARLVFRVHAVRRMFERRCGGSRQVVERGQAIADALPYPSRLVLGWAGTRPLHVVVADDAAAGEVVVVTVYEPDPARTP